MKDLFSSNVTTGKMGKRFELLAFLFMLSAVTLFAQSYADYYSNARGKNGKALKTALSGIIQNHTVRSYKQLWTDFKSTDVRPDGKIWDMYSNVTNYVPGGNEQGASYKGEGDSYNREHSFPKSWFDDASPMYTDLFHLYPTDGYVNGRRSNYPYGETEGEIYSTKNGFSKLGKCTIPGYTGTVFEPNDEYKGDLARTYFYMVTAYEDQVSSWNSDMLNHTAYPAFTNWALTMFLRWAGEDPVSEKETQRNAAVYSIQHNRNPYIDYPGLEQYVWGSMTSTAFDPSHYVKPGDVTPSPSPDPNPDPTPEPTPDPTPDPVPDEGVAVYRMLTDASELKAGEQVIVVCTGRAVAMSASEDGKYRSSVEVEVTEGSEVNTETGTVGKPYVLTLGGKVGAWTLYDAVAKSYVAFSGSKNALNDEQDATVAASQWTIDITSQGAATLSPLSATSRSIRYNPSSPRFACYTTGQQPVSLFAKQVKTGIEALERADSDGMLRVYDLRGRMVLNTKQHEGALQTLPAGIYVVNGKKVYVENK